MQTELRDRVMSLEHQLLATREQLQGQLQAKDKQIAEKDTQLAEKDKQIDQLIKRRTTVTNTTNTTTTNNRFVVEQHINVYGQETCADGTPFALTQEERMKCLSDPYYAVQRLVKIKHMRNPANQNVRCPNVKRARYQMVVQEEGEEKEWESRPKDEVLETLYETNNSELESEAMLDEESRESQRYFQFSDRVRENEGMQKEQYALIHDVIAG